MSNNENDNSGSMELTSADFNIIKTLVYDEFGINLTEQKKSLVVGRLQKIVKAHGFKSFKEYCEFLKNDKAGKSLNDLVNRISTNHTFFFREDAHFDYFTKTVLPEIEKRHTQSGSKDIRIWCAGCSSGEESYTLMICMMEYFGANYSKWNAGLLATDISEPVLNTAQQGIYNDERLGNMDIRLKNKYFNRLPDGRWQAIDEMRKEITFRRFNLMNKTLPFKNSFDIIFCRNVMIYFDTETRMALASRFYNHTTPNGYLFIGHSESLKKDECPYDYVQPATYKRGDK